jgi:hypothetical protein
MDNTYFKKKKKYLRTTIFCIFSNLIAKNPCFKFLAAQRELRISTYLRIRIHIRNDFTDRKNKSDDAVKIFWWQKIRSRNQTLLSKWANFKFRTAWADHRPSDIMNCCHEKPLVDGSNKQEICDWSRSCTYTPPIAWPRRSWLYKQSEACTPVSSSLACNVQCNLSS